MRPANVRSEISKRRKQFSNFPTNSCQRFFVMDAPEIHHSPGLVVVSEFLAAIEASDVGSRAIPGSARQFGWDRLAQCYRRTLVPMGARNKETKQCPQKEWDTEDHIPPRRRREERFYRFEPALRRGAIQNYGPLDSRC